MVANPAIVRKAGVLAALLATGAFFLLEAAPRSDRDSPERAGSPSVELPATRKARTGASSPPQVHPRSLQATDGSLALVLADDSTANSGDPLDARIAAEQKAMRSHATANGLEKLGWSFVEKARSSGDHGYYLLAGHAARAVHTLDADSPAADLLEGHALHSVHRFDDAERVARRLAERRGSPLDYALLGDVLLDQGRLEEAVVAYQKMMQRRPDSRAYARVAEVRLLTGDLEGALEAMRVASRAVSVRDREAFAWVWSRLAMLELQSGHLSEARSASEAAASAAPGLAIAELGRGRVLLVTGDAAGAVAALERSIATNPLPDTMRALADAYTAAGRDEDAARILAELQAGGASVDPRGFSLWLAETGRETSRALWLASAELEKRRDVYTFDALAMASASAGKLEDAQRFMRDALAAGTEDPRLWYHAGVVAAASGKHAEARDWFLKARGAEQVLLPSLRRDLASRLAAAEQASVRAPAQGVPCVDSFTPSDFPCPDS
jgi:tetratricopeptide (TPR) repeat protein